MATSKPSRGGLAAGSAASVQPGKETGGGLWPRIWLMVGVAAIVAAAVASRKWHTRRSLHALSTAAENEPSLIAPLEYRSRQQALPARHPTELPDTSWKLDAVGRWVWMFVGLIVAAVCVFGVIHMTSRPYRMGP